MPYLAKNNGQTIIWQDSVSETQAGEVVFSAHPTPDQLTSAFPGYAAATNNANLKQQIGLLEGTVTARRIRESILGTDGGWMSSLNTQIAALRSQLT